MRSTSGEDESCEGTSGWKQIGRAGSARLFQALGRKPMWPSGTKPMILRSTSSAPNVQYWNLDEVFREIRRGDGAGESEERSEHPFLADACVSSASASGDSLIVLSPVEDEWPPPRDHNAHKENDEPVIARTVQRCGSRHKRSADALERKSGVNSTRNRMLRSGQIGRLHALASTPSSDLSLTTLTRIVEGADGLDVDHGGILARDELSGAMVVGNMDVSCHGVLAEPEVTAHATGWDMWDLSIKGRKKRKEENLLAFTELSTITSKATDPDPEDLRAIFKRMISDHALQGLTDVVLVVKGERFSAHRAVLAASSPFFYAMFTNDMKERNMDEIELKDLEPGAWEIALQYIYTASADIPNVEAAFVALGSARRFNLARLEDFIEEFLKSKVSIHNCFDLMDLSETYMLEGLNDACFKMLERSFHKLAESPSLAQCPPELLERLLHSKKLIVRSEADLFFTLIKWIGVDAENRTHHAPELMHLVRLEEIPEWEVAKMCTNHVARDIPFVALTMLDLLLGFRAPRIQIGSLGTRMTEQIPGLSRRGEQPFTFWSEVRDIRTRNTDEDIIRTPWDPEPTGKYLWRLKIYPQGYGKAKGEFLSMYLQVAPRFKGDALDFTAEYELYLVNRRWKKDTIFMSTSHHFTPEANHWGFHRLVSVSDLGNPYKGFIDERTDAIIVGASIYMDSSAGRSKHFKSKFKR